MAEIINIQESWEGHSGLEVEQFIKEQFGDKYGYINLRFNGDNNTYYIECFASEAAYDEYESDKENKDHLLLQNVQIPISTVQGDSYTALLGTSIPNSAKLVAAKEKLEIPLCFRGVKIGQLGNENAGAAGTLIIERSTDGGSTFTEVGRQVGILPSEEYENKDKYTNVDIMPYLSEGAQMLRVRASYTYQDAEGNNRTATSANVPIGALVTKTALKVVFRYNYEQPISAYDSLGSAQGFPLNNFYFVHGAVDKVLHIEVKGSVGTQTLTYNISAEVDNQAPASVPSLTENSSYGFMTHGVRRVKAWLTCDDGLGNTITSDVLVNRVMVVNENTPNADMTKPYILLQNVKSEVNNYVQTTLCSYAVYSPVVNEDGTITNTGDPINVAFLLTSYTEDYDTIAPEEYFRVEQEVKPNTANNLLTTVEIEAEEGAEIQQAYDAYFRVRRITANGSTDFMKESTNETNYDITVDNTTSASPVSGASFLMNPKVRNNTEANPARILNARNNNMEITSKWTGFGFVNDGWVTASDGQKVLRIPAGSRLEIELNPFRQFLTNANSSMTMEVDFAVHNVTNESDPILDMSDATPAGGFRGLRLNALEGWIMTTSYTSKNDCLFAWREGHRTYISVNLNHQVKPNMGDCTYASTATNANGTTPLARVIMNGDCVREIPYAVDNNEEWTSNANNKLILGNDGADMDIYSIRIYENKQLEMTDLLLKNYVASRPTAEEKQAVRERNDLMTSGRISLDKVKNRGINSMIWHGELPYHSSQGEQSGWYEYFRYDANGNYLPELSGTNCKQTKSLSIKGQGSTAKTYYDWNQQDDNSKVSFIFDSGDKPCNIKVAIADFHESIVISEPKEGKATDDADNEYTGLIVEINGGNLGKNYPVDESPVAYPYSNGMVTVPDGWIDGNGKYRGKGYMVAEGTALAQKKVIKINYASSMQSHLIGACTSYDLLHRAVVGATPLQERVPTAVTAKHTEPFMLFQQSEGSSNVYFKGMGNYGAGKMDKVSWGYAKKKHPMFALIEGSDNNLPMTGFRVPFDKVTAVYSPDDEGWLYNGVQNWDYDGGATEEYNAQSEEGWQFVIKKKTEAPTVAIRDRWADICNFIYLHAPHVKYFVGTFADFKQREEAKNWNDKYFCTAGEDAFKLKRYCYITEQWVDAGLLNESTMTYKPIDLRDDAMTKATWDAAVQAGTSSQYADLAKSFNAAITQHGKDYIKYFLNEKSLRFNYAYVLSLLAGTDNSDKNTYFEIMPYATTVADDNAFSAWWKEMTGNDFDFSGIYEAFMNGDDMDSILRTDNNSHQTKPYYIDRMHPYADEDPEKRLYEGHANALFNFCEAAYEATGELSSTMNNILEKMCTLVNASDRFYGDIAQDAKVSAWGFMHKYFFNIQHYFPEIAYMEQARIRYEFPHLIGFVSSGSGARAIKPISQSLGSQLQNELQYVDRRLIYMASYAHFGAFYGNTSYSIGLSDATDSLSWMPQTLADGNASTYKVKVKPHQYIYPTAAIGQTAVNPHVRVSPYEEYEFIIATGQHTSDTGISLMGVNYYTSVGNFGDISVQPTRAFEVKGKRLIEFVAEPTTLYNGQAAFRPSNIAISNATQLRRFSIKGCAAIGGLLNAKALTRCQSIDLRNTAIYEAQFPASEVLSEIRLGANIQKFVIDDTPMLTSLSFGGYDKLIQFEVGEDVGELNTKVIVTNIYNQKKDLPVDDTFQLKTLRLRNIQWTGAQSLNHQVLMWLTESVANCSLTGVIEVAETTSTVQSNITYERKVAIVNKWGNVDDKGSEDYKGLLLQYRQIPLTSFSVIGNYYYSDAEDGAGSYPFTAQPNSQYANDFVSVEWKAEAINNGIGDNSLIFEVNPVTGMLSIAKAPALEQSANNIFISISAERIDGSIVESGKELRVFQRKAQLGDLVYADGTFGPVSEDDGKRTPIGVCFYVAPTDENGDIIESLFNPNDKHKRLMVALEDATCTSSGGTKNTSFYFGAFPGTQAANSVYGPSGQLKVDGLSDIYDIPTIANIGTLGISGNTINTSTLRDGESQDHGFKSISADLALGDGFAFNENAGLVSQRTFADISGSVNLSQADLLNLVGKDENGEPLYQAGDVVNSGYAKTLKIIQHRNHVLSMGISDVNLGAGVFSQPAAGAGFTELDSLANLMDTISNWFAGDPNKDANPNKWKQLYWPAASAAYAYQPNEKNLKAGESLNARFKAHNWFLPTGGMLGRLYWYTKVAKTESEGNVLAPATDRNLFVVPSSSNYWSCTEPSSNNSWYVFFSNGVALSGNKCGAYVVRAVAAF